MSPESTSTSRRSSPHGRARRADGVAVPSGCSCTATACRRTRPRLSGEATTTSGSGPSGRAASSTQSTIRRPRSGCRCFGVAERMRVPSPPAITTAASVRIGHGTTGAPGFEPGITGPKPVALPLGHAPRFGEVILTAVAAGARRAPRPRSARARRRRTRSATSASTGTSTTTTCETATIQETSRTSSRRALAADADVERDRGDREQDDEPPVDRADEDEDALDERDDERDPQPVVAQPPAEAGAAVLDRQPGGPCRKRYRLSRTRPGR